MDIKVRQRGTPFANVRIFSEHYEAAKEISRRPGSRETIQAVINRLLGSALQAETSDESQIAA
ncbi:hypothetical protein Lepto7375DRAFT_7430 [Leptolyngbya sp. PCC 7375]|nr:hypothetical protein Lepto7375DRAFT_7430 [Leptolyngbya sp. PCC 7375]